MIGDCPGSGKVLSCQIGVDKYDTSEVIDTACVFNTIPVPMGFDKINFFTASRNFAVIFQVNFSIRVITVVLVFL